MSEPPVPGLVLEPTSYADPAAQALTEQVQAYYRTLYGGTDDSPLGTAELMPPYGLFLLGRLDGEAVAMGGWRLTDETDALGARRPAEIRRMFTAAAARRRGVARALLTELERSAAAAGVDVLALSTGSPQRDAIAFYRSAGYVDVEPFGFHGHQPGVVCLARRLRA